MSIRANLIIWLAVVSPVLATRTIRAQSPIPPGQIDTFESGTTLNWGIGPLGSFSPPTVQPGGPNGTGDHFLQVISGQGGAPPRMAVLNRTQWAGNYLGINTIDMDVINTSTTALAVRIGFNSTLTSSGFVSATPVNLPPVGSGGNTWTHITFSLSDATMIPVNIPPQSTFSQLQTNIMEFRILSAQLPDYRGDTIVATLGVDNIRARLVPVPEPGCVFAVILAATGSANVFRRFRASRVFRE